MIEFTQRVSYSSESITTSVRLLGNVVMLRPLPTPDKSCGGVVLPKQRKYEPDNLQYVVVAVGPGITVRKKGKPPLTIPIDLAVGDRVLISPIHGNKYAFNDGSGWIIVEYPEIVAKWKPTTEAHHEH